MEGARRGGKSQDLLAKAREQPGVAAALAMSWWDQRDDDEVIERRLVAMTVLFEVAANLKAMRFELRSFLKAMASAKR